MHPLFGVTPADCPFCELAAGTRDPDAVAYRTEGALAFPNLYQRDANRGHFLVVPAEHVPDLYRLPSELYTELLGAVATVARAVRSAFSAEGITVHQHNELAGGQDVFHLHFHVIPRFSTDRFYEQLPTRHEIPLAVRAEQAARVRDHLTAPVPPHPRDVHGADRA